MQIKTGSGLDYSVVLPARGEDEGLPVLGKKNVAIEAGWKADVQVNLH